MGICGQLAQHARQSAGILVQQLCVRFFHSLAVSLGNVVLAIVYAQVRRRQNYRASGAGEELHHSRAVLLPKHTSALHCEHAFGLKFLGLLARYGGG
jgi:hypothetical protein